MAFYPDELSPIEKLRTTGKSPELTDLGVMSYTRRQWKSLVLGKKDLGMNGFATIAEEKEEEMSSDGSNGANVGQNATAPLMRVPNKKITFPKPRKYISSRAADGKDEEALKSPEAPFVPAVESVSEKKLGNLDDLSKIVNSPKMNLPEVRQLVKGKKGSQEGIMRPKQEIVNYALSEANIDKQRKDFTTLAPMLTGWPKADDDKKQKDDKKRISPAKTLSKKPEQKKLQNHESRKVQGNGENANKTLNMKDVVNVYKNLAYGTKDEIKSFVEKLSFVKDEEKAANDKKMLSMMNLKALETKIKDLEKKCPEGAQPKKRVKIGKKSRKLHMENLARHKVVKVPATLDYPSTPEKRKVSCGSAGDAEQRRKPSEEKVPWKYVGTQSVLDKTYFVYPTYPLPEKKKLVKKTDSENKKAKKEVPEEATPKTRTSQTKVKQSREVILRQNLGARLSNTLALPANRSSATTVCTVEFRPETSRETLCSSDHSLLVYLHGTKATYVNSPYSDKQFSRVKFFRKDGSRAPLIRGIVSGAPKRAATVRNVRLPERPNSDRVYHLLDFEEDIQNINEFLRSQNRSGGPAPGKGEPRFCRSRKGRRDDGDDLLTDEISRGIENLQCLPDTEESRQIVRHFFEKLDRRIERSKAQQISSNNNNNNNCLIPIVGY